MIIIASSGRKKQQQTQENTNEKIEKTGCASCKMAIGGCLKGNEIMFEILLVYGLILWYNIG